MIDELQIDLFHGLERPYPHERLLADINRLTGRDLRREDNLYLSTCL